MPNSCPCKRPAVERAGALLSRVETCEQVEERRLASAVGADERGDRVPLRLEVVHVDGYKAAEAIASRRRQSRMGSGFGAPGTDSTPSKRFDLAIERDLPLVTQDSLWSEHDEQDQTEAHRSERDRLHLGGREVRQHERRELLDERRRSPRTDAVPRMGPNTVAAPPSSSMVQIQNVVVRPIESGEMALPCAHTMPASALITPPITSACILKPVDVLAERPHGVFVFADARAARDPTGSC